jgi:DUF1365 family protein
MLASAVYEGSVKHRRHLPRPHAFGYRMAQLYLDLDEVEEIFARRWLWSSSRRNVAEFRRADFLGPHALSLTEAVRARIYTSTGMRSEGPIRLLTHLRYFGYIFNPVSFYYCYSNDGVTLEHIVAEITNTPWRERHAYVLATTAALRRGRAWHWEFQKAFHVSPFLPMARDYRWTFTSPGDDLHVHMSVRSADALEFDAALALQRRPLNAWSLARVLWRYPMMTGQVIAAIHWQALRLWLKGTPVHDHPPLRTRQSA